MNKDMVSKENLKDLTIQKLISLIGNDKIEIRDVQMDYDTENITSQNKMDMMITPYHTGEGSLTISFVDREKAQMFAKQLAGLR